MSRDATVSEPQPVASAVTHDAMHPMPRPPLVLALVALACVVVTPAAAVAGDNARVFVRYAGAEADAIADAAGRFEAALLAAGNLELAGTTEMEAVYADCAEDLGVNAQTQRDCQLRAANRLFVEHLLELEASATDANQFEIVLSVWNPSSNAKVHAAIVELDGTSLDDALRKGLPSLAAQYRCFRGEDAQCGAGSSRFDAGLVPAGTRPETFDMVPAPHATDDAPCPTGQEITRDTAGRCCWPGQAWSGDACVGMPTRCPDGLVADAETQACLLPACEAGQVRTTDGVHCCWPGQGWSGAQNQCLGRPRCPDGLTAVNDTCTPDRDLDGIEDDRDLCAGEPEDLDGIFDEDGCPDIDMDGDGIPDEQDRCMLYPEDLDGFEDDDGCREEHDLDPVIAWSLVGGGLGVLTAGFIYEAVVNPGFFEDSSTTTTEDTRAELSTPGTVLLATGIGVATIGIIWMMLPPDLPDLTVSSDGTQAFVQYRTVF